MSTLHTSDHLLHCRAFVNVSNAIINLACLQVCGGLGDTLLFTFIKLSWSRIWATAQENLSSVFWTRSYRTALFNKKKKMKQEHNAFYMNLHVKYSKKKKKRT